MSIEELTELAIFMQRVDGEFRRDEILLLSALQDVENAQNGLSCAGGQAYNSQHGRHDANLEARISCPAELG